MIKKQKEQGNDIKRTIKDSVFTDLFGIKKYLFQLYQALHPEDTTTTEEDLTDIRLKNILVDDLYNDLGFSVGERLIILVEAQSTWTMNIIIRALLYLAQTYQEYFDNRGIDLYHSVKVQMPKPELYVIYTKHRVHKPEQISLSKEFFKGEETALEVQVKMLYGEDKESIIGQYVTFSKVFDEQRKQYGWTREAVLETIKICKDKNILKEYLENRESEVIDIMMTLYDEEKIMRTRENRIRQEEREKGIQQGLQTGIQTGIQTGKVKGEEMMLELIQKLIVGHRFEDIPLIKKDKAYRQRLYKEYGIGE